jgi:N-methylhydantoinase A
MRKLRLGVDVGGTFTDVVAIDAQSREVIARVKVPTTHGAAAGVAAGIVDGIARLFADGTIDPAEVSFIAHSTTQATNALLEGDVAQVGVLGLLNGFGALARLQMRFGRLQLAPGLPFEPKFAFAPAHDRKRIEAAVGTLKQSGSEVLAATQAFSVDRPQGENDAVTLASEAGLFATSGHDVSTMYGLRARTRTAAINAAILPKMVRTARMTAGAVREAAIDSPLMVMRSDGGVMDAREMERRPILTLLSGPAAGVAGALLHENVTDGIFIEVGGTSSDCSAIRAGMPQMRPARVGGHRTMLRTLDVRTLGIAGGSLMRAADGKIVDVGPRSAHIAGLSYACFLDPSAIDGARFEAFRPSAHDSGDYVALRGIDGTHIAVTPTCAANFLGYVPASAFAHGSAESAGKAFAVLGAQFGRAAESIATEMLDIASAKIIAAIEELIADYELDRHAVVVVGGGGGAAALIPYAAKKTGLDFRLARDAEVISPIGVALALVREVVVRTLVDPSPDDNLGFRGEAQDAVIAAGASPEGVETVVEIDSQRNIVRATASGASELAETAAHGTLDEGARLAAAARLMRAAVADVRAIARTPGLTVYEGGGMLRVLDRGGVGRLTLRDGTVRVTAAGCAAEDLRAAIEDATAFGDVGRAMPNLYVVHGARIADYSGLLSADQAVALAEEELAGREPDAPVLIITSPRPA